MAPTRYGDMSHWIILKDTTRMASVRMSKTPARLMITVKTNVDKPKIMAKVPAIESRSFHVFMFFSKSWMVNGFLKILCYPQ